MTTATRPTVTDEQAAILAAHAHVVQGGFSTPEIERERLLKDASHASDPQAFINETVGKFAAEVLQAQLAAADRASVAADESATVEVIKPDTFEFAGEVLELDPAVGHELLAEYRQAAEILHEAKARAKRVEQQIMKVLGGFEHGAIDGMQLFHWPFVDSTTFDAKAFKDAGDDYRKLYDHFCKTKTTRRFRVEGTVGVD